MAPTLELTFSEVAGNPWGGQVAARYEGEPSGPFPAAEGIEAKAREDIRWYVEEFMDLPEGGNETRARRVEEALAALGRSLWAGLDQPVVHTWLGQVMATGGGRLELRAATEADELAFRTPWELLRVGDGHGTLLHQLGVTVVRRVRRNVAGRKPHPTGKGLRVLVVVCRPEEAGFLDPRHTPEAILEALEKRPEVEVEFCRPGTLAALNGALQRAVDEGRPFHVVHFDGHGTTLPAERGVGALCFEKADGSLDLVRARKLGDTLAAFRIPLVVLEACRTATKDPFAQDTVAGALLREGVGSVVAMGHAVHVDLTRELMGAFYEAVARGKTVGDALLAARRHVFTNSERRLGLGADAPTVALQDWFVPQLYQAGDDPALLPRRPARREARPAPPFVGFPPAPRAGFQGRGHALHRLERTLLRHPVVVVDGPGGLGKTALAREAARWWTRTGMFPGGAFFLSLEVTASPEALVQTLGEALDGVGFHKEPDPRARLCERLAEAPALIVLDNYESALPAFNGGRPTPPGLAELARAWTAAGARLLVTSRDPEVGLDEAWPFPLTDLSVSEAVLLLVRLLERAGIDRPRRVARGLTVEALTPLVRRVGGHPLALELVAPYLDRLTVDAVLAELADLLARAEQDHPEERNRRMAASLAFSTRHLSATARTALPAVALLAGGALENMAPLVAGLEPEAWAAVREELERTGLVRVEGPALRPHPVLAEMEGRAPDEALRQRFVAVVRQLCAKFDKLVRSADPRPAMATLAVSEATVRRAVEHALAAGDVHWALAIADSLTLFLRRSGRGGEGRTLMAELHRRAGAGGGELTVVGAMLAREAAWACASTDPDGAVAELKALLRRLDAVQGWDAREERALALRTLGRIHHNIRGRPGDALRPLEEAEELFAALEDEGRADSTNRAAVLGDRANALCDLGRRDEALQVAEFGLALDRARGDAHAIARGLGQVAQILDDAGRASEAETRYREALAAAEKAQDVEAVGITRQSLGNLILERGRLDEAATHLRAALAAFRRAGDERGRIGVLNSLGSVDLTRGELEAALAWFEQSRVLAERLGDTVGESTARRNRAVALKDLADRAGDAPTAERHLRAALAEDRAALALNEQLGQPRRIAIAHNNLADTLRRLGELDEAEDHARQALTIFERIGDPDTWKTLWILEEIAAARGDEAAAADFRARKEAARDEAARRAGPQGLPPQLVVHLLRLALTARRHERPLDEALAADGAPEGWLAGLEQAAPWLVAHLRALAGGRPRPPDAPPPPFAALIDQAWAATNN